MILTLIFIVVAFIVIAMLWTEGMWANALRLTNTVFGAIVAMNNYEPVADYLDNLLPSFTYVADYLAVWFLFAIAFNLFRAITDSVSKHRVRFKMPVEHTFRVLFAVGTAWVMICFICATLHMAPLARTCFRGGFGKEPMANYFFGTAPDRMFLGFMHSRSRTALSASQPRVFDPEGEFILKYGARRQMLQEHNAQNGTIRVKK